MRQLLWLLLLYTVVSGCKLASTSAVSVINGRPVTVESAETLPVVPINGNDILCTGTFLSPTTILTGAHCISDPSRPDGGVNIGNAETPLRVFVHPQFSKAMQKYKDLASKGDSNTNSALASKLRDILQNEVLPTDIAVILVTPKLANMLKTKQFYSVPQNPPKVKLKDSIYVVGYGIGAYSEGKPDPTTAGIKRDGIATITDVTDFSVSVSSLGNGPEASVGVGDSGGPWVLCAAAPVEGRCSSFQLVAITQNAGYVTFLGAKGTGVLLASAGAQAFLQSTIQCSQGPCADNFLGDSKGNSSVMANNQLGGAATSKSNWPYIFTADQVTLLRTVQNALLEDIKNGSNSADIAKVKTLFSDACTGSRVDPSTIRLRPISSGFPVFQFYDAQSQKSLGTLRFFGTKGNQYVCE